MDPLIALLRGREEDILRRVFASARTHGYTRYSSPQLEAWRTSVQGLTEAMTTALELAAPLDFGLDDDLTHDPLTQFGSAEALKHRSRGVTLTMFLGLTKYYRDAFADACCDELSPPDELARRRRVLTRLFDRIELGFCEAWSTADRESGSTALEAANRQLANEKCHYLTVLESLHDSVFVVASDGHLTYANAAAKGLAGLQRPNQALPSWLPPLCHPHKPVQVDLEVRGLTHTVVARAEPVLGVTAHVEGVVVVLHDLTELREADRERRELQAVFDAVASSAADGVVLLDEKGQLTFCNRAAERLFGVSRSELLSRDLVSLLGQDPLRDAADAQPTTRLARTQKADGTLLQLELTLSRVQSGRGTHRLCVLRDVTERHRLESQANTSARLEAVGRLAGGIAHEINTPIQFVGDSLHFLKEASLTICAVARDVLEHASATSPDAWVATLKNRVEQLDLEFLLEETPRAIDRAAEGIWRVADIVRAMKEFGHPGSGQMTHADLNHALKNALVVSRPSWKYVATTSFEPGELPPVRCRVEQLNQVFLNLLVNAADAIRERGEDTTNGRITVRTRLEGSDAVIEVEDSGVGLSPAAEAHLFQPFFTTKPPGQGTGQGLALSRHIVTDTHHGTLSYRTKLGQGTTFIVRVPIAGGPAVSPAQLKVAS